MELLIDLQITRFIADVLTLLGALGIGGSSIMIIAYSFYIVKDLTGREIKPMLTDHKRIISIIIGLIIIGICMIEISKLLIKL